MIISNLNKLLQSRWVLGSYAEYATPGLTVTGPYYAVAGGINSPMFINPSASDDDTVLMMPEALLAPSLRGKFKTYTGPIYLHTFQLTSTINNGSATFAVSSPCLVSIAGSTRFLTPNTYFSFPEMTTGASYWGTIISVFSTSPTVTLTKLTGMSWVTPPTQDQIKVRRTSAGNVTVTPTNFITMSSFIDLSMLVPSGCVEGIYSAGTSLGAPSFTDFSFPYDTLEDQLGVVGVPAVISALLPLPMIVNKDDTANDAKWSFLGYYSDLSGILYSNPLLWRGIMSFGPLRYSLSANALSLQFDGPGGKARFFSSTSMVPTQQSLPLVSLNPTAAGVDPRARYCDVVSGLLREFDSIALSTIASLDDADVLITDIPTSNVLTDGAKQSLN